MTGCEIPEWLGVARVIIIFVCGIAVGAMLVHVTRRNK